MYSTQVYIFQQRTRVLMMDTGGGETFTYRYDPVYAKRLTINKGVDNVLLFEFVNQEEKPVNITGSSFVFRAINQQGNQILVDEPLVILNATTGRAKVTLSAEQLLEMKAQPANYSIVRQQPNGGLEEAVFTNAQAGARAPVDIVDSVLPQFVPSTPLTIPTTNIGGQFSIGGSGYDAWPGWNGQYWAGNGSYYSNWGYQNTEFYSSFIEPRGPVTTIQMDLIGYTGTIKAQAAENYQSHFYNVTESTTYLNETRTIYMNIVGWHPLLRLAFNNSVFSTPIQPGYPAVVYAVVEDGQVVDTIITNPGLGYLAPPLINFIGDGAGATATSTINEQGELASITITNPGSGYWPVPTQALNPNGVPVSPQNQGALVIVSTGYIVNLMYR